MKALRSTVAKNKTKQKSVQFYLTLALEEYRIFFSFNTYSHLEQWCLSECHLGHVRVTLQDFLQFWEFDPNPVLSSSLPLSLARDISYGVTDSIFLPLVMSSQTQYICNPFFLPEMFAARQVIKERWSYNISRTLDRKLQRLRQGENKIADSEWISSQVLPQTSLVSLHLLSFCKQTNCMFSFPPRSLVLFWKVSALSQWCLWNKIFQGVGKDEAFFLLNLAQCSSCGESIF